MVRTVLACGMADIQNNDSTELGTETAPGHFGLLVPLSQQVKKAATVPADEWGNGLLLTGRQRRRRPEPRTSLRVRRGIPCP